MGTTPDNLTELLERYDRGDRAALDELVPRLYDELRRIAGRFLAGERINHTLQPTALVNEAFLRLVDQPNIRWQNRAHFFGIAAHVMRNALVDHARGRGAEKRGGGRARVTLVDDIAAVEEHHVDLLVLDEALRSLEAVDPGKCRVVELRYFGGLSIEESADVLGVSPATVKREWTVARAWLFRFLAGETLP